MRVFACMADDMPFSSARTVGTDPKIALYRNAEGLFFATTDTCSHEEWSLGTDSDIEGNEVTCPLHMARFDFTTGKVLCLPAIVDLRTYSVEVEGDGSVYIVV